MSKDNSTGKETIYILKSCIFYVDDHKATKSTERYINYAKFIERLKFLLNYKNDYPDLISEVKIRVFEAKAEEQTDYYKLLNQRFDKSKGK